MSGRINDEAALRRPTAAATWANPGQNSRGRAFQPLLGEVQKTGGRYPPVIGV